MTTDEEPPLVTELYGETPGEHSPAPGAVQITLPEHAPKTIACELCRPQRMIYVEEFAQHLDDKHRSGLRR